MPDATNVIGDDYDAECVFEIMIRSSNEMRNPRIMLHIIKFFIEIGISMDDKTELMEYLMEYNGYNESIAYLLDNTKIKDEKFNIPDNEDPQFIEVFLDRKIISIDLLKLVLLKDTRKHIINRAVDLAIEIDADGIFYQCVNGYTIIGDNAFEIIIYRGIHSKEMIRMYLSHSFTNKYRLELMKKVFYLANEYDILNAKVLYRLLKYAIFYS